MAALASWEETSNQAKIDFQKTRDCQPIAGFLLNTPAGNAAAMMKGQL